MHPSKVSAKDTETAYIETNDHFRLAASVFRPIEPRGEAPIVLICSATGVKRGYYAHYARYLAEHGFLAVTFDYRGIGDSRPHTLNKFRARMHEWGEKDINAVIGWIQKIYPKRSIVAVVHSVGGQVLGLAEKCKHLAAVVMVGSQSGYWRLWPFPLNYGLFLLWYALIPVLSTLLAYFPSRLFGMGESLPAGVAMEWASWGRAPKYLLSKQHPPKHFAHVEAPILALSFSDDTFAPARATDELLTFYPNARIEHRHLTPRDIRVQSIGHFGFFKDKFRDTLWQATLVWLRERTPEGKEKNA